MSVLVDGFTIVARLEAIDRVYGGDWSAFRAELPNPSCCRDQHLVRVGFRTRPEFRAWLRVLWQRDFKDAFRILHGTELSNRPLEAGETAKLQARLARTDEVALVYRRQPVRPAWVVVDHGRLRGAEVLVAGAYLAAAGRSDLVVPEGWTTAQAVPLDDEPEPGDEFLPTWHEYVAAEADVKLREHLLRCGPEAVLAYAEAVGSPKPFGGRIHMGTPGVDPGTAVLDDTGHTVVDRWKRKPY